MDLYWLPLGAGGHVVRWNGVLYERFCAWRDHRPVADLYHCALVVELDGTRYAVEMGPVWNVTDPCRGVVAEGPVGSRWLGRFRAFRYEMRCWAQGRIPDVDEAVDSPVRVTGDPDRVAALLAVLPGLPTLTWGRDELGAGEMWNSNSAVSWALAMAGLDTGAIRPPPGGRAPGWGAGLALAGRQSRGRAQTAPSPTASARRWRVPQVRRWRATRHAAEATRTAAPRTATASAGTGP